MARKVQVLLEDDIDGGEAAETVSFSLDGRAYEIDLNEANAQSLREVLAPWIAAGRRAGGRAPEGRPRSARRSHDTADIRRWAAENGIPVSSRGRISADLRARYEAAH
jgi:nucleoid-associated protein Lsr2